LVGFRQVSKINQDRRTREEAITDLDKCPKPYKIPHPHPRGGDDNIFGGFRQVSEIAKDRRTRTREEALLQNSAKVHFGTPHLHARGGDDLVHFWTLV
jgi:hypothetical protein